MEDSKPEAAPRDVFAELDEIIATMKTVLKAVANIGEEIIQYRQSWKDMAEKMALAMATLNDHFDEQAKLNEAISESTSKSINIAIELEEKILRIDSDSIGPLTDGFAGLVNVTSNLEERLAALENGYRLILPG